MTMVEPFTTGDSVIAIGVIGPKPLVDRTEEALKSFPTFVPHLRPLSSEEELTDYERELLGDLSVYSGAGSGYLGWRAGIEPDGTWRFFIAGD